MHRLRDAGAFASEQQGVVGLIHKAMEGLGGLGGEQNQAPLCSLRRRKKIGPGGMQANLRLIAIV